MAAALFVILALVPLVHAQCPSGYVLCPAGSSSSGGCYNAASGYTCSDGLLCYPGLTACPRGSAGQGGCYNRSTGGHMHQWTDVPSRTDSMSPRQRWFRGLLTTLRRGAHAPMD